MSASIVALPAFHDLKKHNAHPGGVSDGGVVCIGETLTTQGVEIAPPPGLALGGFSLPASGVEVQAVNIPVLPVLNFDPDNDAYFDAYIVFEDGSMASVVPADLKPQLMALKNDGSEFGGVGGLPLSGLIITYPNKLLVKLVSYGGYALPTKRVLLKGCLLEYDKPRDLNGS
jgi:hypothetical protein